LLRIEGADYTRKLIFRLKPEATKKLGNAVDDAERP
jgi:hypothetical protein